MKINWKVRVRNPVWWAEVAMALLVPIVSYFGLTVRELTSWQTLFDTLLAALGNPYVIGLVAVSLWNTVNDPTTAGVNDSAQALTYTEPKS